VATSYLWVVAVAVVVVAVVDLAVVAGLKALTEAVAVVLT
jgi:hypothetical protein